VYSVETIAYFYDDQLQQAEEIMNSGSSTKEYTVLRASLFAVGHK